MGASRRPASDAVHGGAAPDRDGPLTTPLYRTSTFRFPTTEALAAASAAGAPFYTRHGHPNFEVVERKVARLHGAEAGLLFASGLGAMAAVVQTHARAGGRIVASRDLYGGTAAQLAWLAPRMDFEIVTVAADDAAALSRALPGALLCLGETPTNPLLRLLDVRAWAEACRSHGVPFAVDGTFAGPVLHRPLDDGADLVVESATKSLGGHSDLVGGIVCGSEDHVAPLRQARKLLGAIADPGAAWLLERGLKTLPLRVERQAASALALARRLEADERVERVFHPGLDSHPDRDLARARGLDRVGLVTFVVAGGAAGARRVADGVRMIANAPSLGGVESLVSIPAFTSHAALSAAEREAAGIPDGCIRLSVGLEDPEDLWADLDQALGA